MGQRGDRRKISEGFSLLFLALKMEERDVMIQGMQVTSRTWEQPRKEMDVSPPSAND